MGSVYRAKGGALVKAAKRQIEEINRLKIAIKETKSKYLWRDYQKSIRRLESELREYCSYRGLDYETIAERLSTR